MALWQEKTGRISIMIIKENFNIALTKDAKSILKKILESNILPDDAYLAGGTAIAIYYGHRLSVDFDFFTEEQADLDKLLSRLKEVFYKTDVSLSLPHSLICELYIDKNIYYKFSVFNLRYKLLNPPVFINENPGINNFTLKIASVLDLACMKCIAIAQRGLAKDFIDLFYLLNNTSLDFTEIFEKVKIKYDLSDRFLYQLFTGLVYFDEAEKQLLSEKVLMYNSTTKKYRNIQKKEWGKIKKFYIKLAI